MRSYFGRTLLLCFCLFMATTAFAQNAQLGGTVTDPSGALLPGVTITATNPSTGVVTTTISNESGTYAFPSLQPGRTYRVSASLPSFQTLTYTDVELAPTAPVRPHRLSRC